MCACTCAYACVCVLNTFVHFIYLWITDVNFRCLPLLISGLPLSLALTTLTELFSQQAREPYLFASSKLNLQVVANTIFFSLVLFINMDAWDLNAEIHACMTIFLIIE